MLWMQYKRIFRSYFSAQVNVMTFKSKTYNLGFVCCKNIKGTAILDYAEKLKILICFLISCLRKKKTCLWKHLEESWEAIEHCVSFKLRCISMFDTLMLCWTTSASSSHFLAWLIFVNLKVQDLFFGAKNVWIHSKRSCIGYCHINCIACTLWWGCKKTNILQNPSWPSCRTVGWVDGSFGLIEWLPLNWWQNPVIKWEPISESLSTLQFGG